MSSVLKRPINLITSPNPVYSDNIINLFLLATLNS
jgi:hypothetical protein